MELDLKNLILLLWKRIWIIALAVVLVGVGAFALSKWGMTPVYSATISMYVNNSIRESGQTTVTQSDLSASQKLVDTYIVILKSDAVLDQVAAKLKDITAEEIRGKISAAAINNTEAFSVTVNDSSAGRAREIANTIAEMSPGEIIRVVKAGSVEVIDYASTPTAPSSPNILRNTALGMLLGAVLAVGGVLLFAMFDTTIHTEEDLKRFFTIPIVGVIPDISEAEHVRGYKAISKGEQ